MLSRQSPLFLAVATLAKHQQHPWFDPYASTGVVPVASSTKSLDECASLARLHFGSSVFQGSVQCIGDVCVGISYLDFIKSAVVLGDPWGSIQMSCSEARFDLIVAEVNQLTAQPNHNPTPSIHTYSFGDSSSYHNPVVSLPIEIHSRLRKQGQGTTVALGSHWDRNEIRPRVGVKFLNQDDPITYFLMFDTGCHFTYARIAGSNCPPGYGYRDMKGITERAERESRFGTAEDPHWLQIKRKVIETLEISGVPASFSYTSNVDLAETCIQSVDQGLLGAGRGGEFASAAGVFAYRSGQLLIGPYHRWRDHCMDGREPMFLKLVDEPTAQHAWTVWGATRLSTHDNNGIYHEVQHKWVVDTGAANLEVPPEILESVRALIKQTGSTITPSLVEREFPFISDCYANRASFPVISISFGKYGGQQMVIQLNPTDYTGPIDAISGRCQLLLTGSKLKQVENGYLMGAVLLARLLTIFNDKEGILGMCLPRS